MLRLSVTYTGRVQGVGFRASARDIASEYPVSGFVQNQADGSVRLEVQGDARQVEAFRDTLRLRLEHLIHDEQVEPMAPSPDSVGFVIRR